MDYKKIATKLGYWTQWKPHSKGTNKQCWEVGKRGCFEPFTVFDNEDNVKKFILDMERSVS